MASFARNISVKQYSIIFLLTILYLLFSLSFSEAQVVSYGMRKLALSMNQFGLDMLRTMDRMDRLINASTSSAQQGSFGFCPFCVGSSLAMLLAGLKDDRSKDGKFFIFCLLLFLLQFLF